MSCILTGYVCWGDASPLRPGHSGQGLGTVSVVRIRGHFLLTLSPGPGCCSTSHKTWASHPTFPTCGKDPEPQGQRTGTSCFGSIDHSAQRQTWPAPAVSLTSRHFRSLLCFKPQHYRSFHFIFIVIRERIRKRAKTDREGLNNVDGPHHLDTNGTEDVSVPLTEL